MKKPGDYFFFEDWLDDKELNACSLAAQGLWFRFLCVMHVMRPQGVLMDGIDTYLGYLYPDPVIVNHMRKQLSPLVEELRKNGVFSVGDDQDIPGALPHVAIVNRRMYKKYLKANDKVEKCRFAANARWEKERKSQKTNESRKMGSHAYGCKDLYGTHASDDASENAQAMHNDDVQDVDSKDSCNENVMHSECAEECTDDASTNAPPMPISSFSSNIYINQPTKLNSLLADSLSVLHPKREDSQDETGRLAGVNESAITIQLIAETHDSIFGTPEYRDKIKTIISDNKSRSALMLFSKTAKRMSDPSGYLKEKIEALMANLKGAQ